MRPPRPYDKVEKSPNSMATCKLCRGNIQKGDWRIGQHFFLEKYHKWALNYYHKQCCEVNRTIMNGLKFPPKRKSENMSQMERLTQECNDAMNRSEAVKNLIYNERAELREILRQARLSIAKRLNVPSYMVFHDSVLDSLVQTMPVNRNQFLKVKGLGEKKFNSFGSILIQIIVKYRKRASGKVTSSSKKQKCEEKDDDDVVIEKELSIDDIVDQRFKEAAKNGHVIEL